jgi:hypothetical protein
VPDRAEGATELTTKTNCPHPELVEGRKESKQKTLPPPLPNAGEIKQESVLILSYVEGWVRATKLKKEINLLLVSRSSQDPTYLA